MGLSARGLTSADAEARTKRENKNTDSFRGCNVTAIFLCCFLISVSDESAFAQYFTGPVASGAGGAGRASVDQSESTLLNPAALAHTRDFSYALFYGDGKPSGTTSQSLYGISIADHTEGTILPAAFTFIRNSYKFSGTKFVDSYANITLGNFVYKQIAIGASAVYLENKSSFDDYEQWNGVVGAHYNPTENLGVGFVHYHFINPSKSIPLDLQFKPKTSIAATYLTTEWLRLRVDISQWHTKGLKERQEFQFGVENMPSRFLSIRAGIDDNQASGNTYLTGGVGFNGPVFRIDYAYVHEQGDAKSDFHLVDLRIPF